MDLDDINDVDDLSQATVGAMAERLRQSQSEEQFVYRETELDELWRIADVSLGRQDLSQAQRVWLDGLRDAIVRSHDLVGVESRPVDAAAVLDQLLSRWPD